MRKKAAMKQHKCREERVKRTMVDDAVLQQGLTQVNSFFWIARLTNFHQPRHKLTGERRKKHRRRHKNILMGKTTTYRKNTIILQMRRAEH